LLGFFFLYGKT